MTREMISITQVAKRLGISTRTIRLYEDQGVVAVKRSGRRALLEFEDVEALFLAERLRRDLEVNAAGAGVILEMRRKMMALQQRLRELEEELDRLR